MPLLMTSRALARHTPRLGGSATTSYFPRPAGSCGGSPPSHVGRSRRRSSTRWNAVSRRGSRRKCSASSTSAQLRETTRSVRSTALRASSLWSPGRRHGSREVVHAGLRRTVGAAWGWASMLAPEEMLTIAPFPCSRIGLEARRERRRSAASPSTSRTPTGRPPRDKRRHMASPRPEPPPITEKAASPHPIAG
jgi:hypothetical protein